MLREPSRTTANVVEVLDHVIDKGIVIDAWVRVSLAGVSLLTVEARVVVALHRGVFEAYINAVWAVSQAVTNRDMCRRRIILYNGP
jgi:hypothetical protein